MRSSAPSPSCNRAAPYEEGMVVVRGRLLPEVGAVVQRALEAALEQVPAAAADGTEWSAAQRRADALGVVAESALAGKLDPGSAGDRYQVTVHVDAAALVGPDIAAGAISAEREAPLLRHGKRAPRRQ